MLPIDRINIPLNNEVDTMLMHKSGNERVVKCGECGGNIPKDEARLRVIIGAKGKEYHIYCVIDYLKRNNFIKETN